MAERRLGQKPFNWPAAVLVIGWMGLTFALLILGGNRAISTFGRNLPSPPVVWWPEMSALGFFLLFGPFVLSAVAIFVVPLTGWSRRVGGVLIALGAVSAAAGVAWDAGSGVAVYRHQVVHREAGFGEALRVDRFADAERIETACVITRRRRGPRRAEPRFRLVFSGGRGVELANRGLGGAGGTLAERLSIIRLAHQAAREGGAVRAPARKPDGSMIGSRGCVARLANERDLPLAEIAPLFVVDQSELRPDEYVVVPET